MNNKINHFCKLASFNSTQLDRPTTTEDLEHTTVLVKPTETTTKTTNFKLTTKKSSVTNNHFNVTNSISVNLIQPKNCSTHLVNDVPAPPFGVENQTNSKIKILNHTSLVNNSDNGDVAVLSIIGIHLRIIGDGYNANQSNDNSFYNDVDDSNDEDYSDNDLILVTESYRQKRYLDSTTNRTTSQPKTGTLTPKNSYVFNNDYNVEYLESNLLQHVRETRQATTRRPSNHYRSTSKFVL